MMMTKNILKMFSNFLDKVINVIYDCKGELESIEKYLYSHHAVMFCICEPIFFSMVLIHSFIKRLDAFQKVEVLYILFQFSKIPKAMLMDHIDRHAYAVARLRRVRDDELKDKESLKNVNKVCEDELKDKEFSDDNLVSPLEVFAVFYDSSINYFSNSVVINMFINFVLIFIIFKIILFSNTHVQYFDNTLLKHIYLFF